MLKIKLDLQIDEVFTVTMSSNSPWYDDQDRGQGRSCPRQPHFTIGGRPRDQERHEAAPVPRPVPPPGPSFSGDARTAAFGKPLEAGPPGGRGRRQEGPGLSLPAKIIECHGTLALYQVTCCCQDLDLFLNHWIIVSLSTSVG